MVQTFFCFINLLIERSMIDLTFAGLFKTTLKGVPQAKKIPLAIKMSKSYFIYSTVLQSIIFLIFTLYFALSVFRVAKRIKNGRFRDVPDPYELEKKMANDAKRKKEQGENNEQTGFAYQFDEDDEVQEVRDNKVMDVNGEISSKQQQFDNYHDQNEKAFIKLDAQLLSFMPFIMSFMISNSLFTTNIITICLLTLTIISYCIFNLKRKLTHLKPLQYLYIISSILGNFTFFSNDHDLST